MKLLRKYLLSVARDQLAKVVLINVLAILVGLSLLPIGLLIEQLLDEVIADGDQQRLYQYLLIMLGLFLINLAGSIWLRHLTLTLSKRYCLELRMRITERILAYPRSLFDQRKLGHLNTLTVNDVERIDIMVSSLISSVLPALLMLAGSFFILLYISQSLMIVIALSAPIFASLTILLKQRGTHNVLAYHEAFRNFNMLVLQLLRNLRLVHDEVLEKQYRHKVAQRAEQFREASYGMGLFTKVMMQVQETLLALLGVAVLAAGSLLIARGDLSMGGLVSFYFVLYLARRYYNELVSGIPHVLEGTSSLQTLEHEMDWESKAPYQGLQELEGIGQIELHDVSFGYTADRLLLQHVNTSFTKGQIYLLQGPNGSGKTTLFQMITGYYKPLSGTVLADGYAYDELAMTSLRQHLGIVPQEPQLLDTSIWANITMERDYAKEEVLAAAHLAGVTDFVEELSDGYDTQVGDAGVFLSGGQRQKIALARTLLKKPDFILMDEPTNHLDEGSIRSLISSLRALPHQPGVIVISHNTLVEQVADEVLQLQALSATAATTI